MTITNEILVPVVVLVAWSLVQWLWMLATRLPAIKASGMTLDATIPTGEQMASLPSKARWKADNYNHLMEQPTVFYALAISMALLGLGEGLNETLAWAYVGLRIVHSLFQSLVNKIELRFMLFALSNVPLFWLTINTLTSLS
ncbi:MULTISPECIES: MAPEG family protein [unclassified Oleiphilus]|uniref:MAPEG family protein n=1 Tax=unclassified Oleiphilus TaxID=2631174 RepID=UPI0007C2938C|nr:MULTISPECIES: MAPEG family protein [unclassified Oleiphilus]KZY69397.1 hypothetical protein A3738_04130 [Oleiphilus sp. HI0066]KZY69821.1 hypothetical protein A3738_25350 [Oleiphilus sp. HI0066]KZY75951.1 hypothetical protein A3739_14320 [Oleiphilus sp. HI0067]